MYAIRSYYAFADVTRRAGLEGAACGRAMGVGAFDYDGDGLPDMVIAGGRPDGFIFGPRLFDYQPVDRDYLGRTPTQVTFDFSASFV